MQCPEGGHDADFDVARSNRAEEVFDYVNGLWRDGFRAVEISGVSIDAFECCFGQVIAEQPGLAAAIEPGGFDGDDDRAGAEETFDILRLGFGAGVEGNAGAVAREEIVAKMGIVDGPDDGIGIIGRGAGIEARDVGFFADVVEHEASGERFGSCK
jgi:hypothetical protein